MIPSVANIFLSNHIFSKHSLSDFKVTKKTSRASLEHSTWTAYLQRAFVEGAVLGAIAMSVFLLLALLTYHPEDPSWTSLSSVEFVNNGAGRVGAFSADLLLASFGYFAYIFPLLVAYWGVRVLRERRMKTGKSWPLFFIRLVGFLFIMMASTAIMSVYLKTGVSFLPNNSGGAIGQELGVLALSTFNATGSALILFTFLFLGITLFTGLSWILLVEKAGALLLLGLQNIPKKLAAIGEFLASRRRQKAQRKAQQKEKKALKIPPVVQQQTSLNTAAAAKPSKQKTSTAQPVSPLSPLPVAQATSAKNQQQDMFPKSGEGEKPSLALLDPADPDAQGGFSDGDLEEMSRLLEAKLADFKVSAEVVAVQPGPVITRFEIQPAAGIKASRITGLAQDLARSLAVISVRVVEVIPGRTTVGIEIPNEKREIIRFVEAVGSKKFEDSKSELTFALGKDISGDPVIADLSKMPHLLVAGTTGSGKSVGLNAMLLSLLFKASPAEVRLIMIDPKMLELAVYDGIPHLLAPVVTDMTEAASALRWGVAEMERRYKLMASLGVRNLAGYNRKVDEANAAGEPISDPTWKPSGDNFSEVPEEAPYLEHLPSIVIVIDEFADMMMIVGKKVEELIARIAQKARAAGIHLILATQRPSVDVITGLIKANVPSRMAFQVSSRIDSRTILDQGGAEQLLGYGDMLYLPVGVNVPERVHGAFVSDEEVHRVCDDWRARGEPNYLPEILEDTDINAAIPGMEAPGEGSDDAENDPLYDEAVAHVIESKRASISFVQRKMRIGYNRAARLVEAMEMAGIVSAPGHNGQREVLVPGGERY